MTTVNRLGDVSDRGFLKAMISRVRQEEHIREIKPRKEIGADLTCKVPAPEYVQVFASATLASVSEVWQATTILSPRAASNQVLVRAEERSLLHSHHPAGSDDLERH